MASCSRDSIPFLGESRPQPIPPPEPINCPEIPTVEENPDYRVFVQIGQRQGDYLPGKLYLCIPEAATEIQGTFNAKLSPPNGTFVDD